MNKQNISEIRSVELHTEAIKPEFFRAEFSLSAAPEQLNAISSLSNQYVSIRQTHDKFPSYLLNSEISALFDRGTVRVPEDRALVSLPYLVVVDGTSGVHWKGGPSAIPYGKKTGGEMAAESVIESFQKARPGCFMRNIIEDANQKIALAHSERNLDLTASGSLGGCVGAAAHFQESKVTIAQWGDCLAFWELSDGTIGHSANHTYFHDVEMRSRISSLMDKYSGKLNLDERRQVMWTEFGPHLTEARNRRINGADSLSYPFLCGQKDFFDRIEIVTLPAEKLRTLILVSDGLVSFDKMKEMSTLARDVISRFSIGGLAAVFMYAREAELSQLDVSHVSHSEGLGIAISLRD